MRTDDTPATLGARVRAARERRGYSMRDLCERIGARDGYVSRLEAGEFGEVGSVKLEALGRELGVSLDWLVRGVGRM